MHTRTTPIANRNTSICFREFVDAAVDIKSEYISDDEVRLMYNLAKTFKFKFNFIQKHNKTGAWTIHEANGQPPITFYRNQDSNICQPTITRKMQNPVFASALPPGPIYNTNYFSFNILYDLVQKINFDEGIGIATPHETSVIGMFDAINSLINDNTIDSIQSGELLLINPDRLLKWKAMFISPINQPKNKTLGKAIKFNFYLDKAGIEHETAYKLRDEDSVVGSLNLPPYFVAQNKFFAFVSQDSNELRRNSLLAECVSNCDNEP